MNIKTMLAANIMAVVFLGFTAYCLNTGHNGFAVASFIIAACSTVIFTSKDYSK